MQFWHAVVEPSENDAPHATAPSVAASEAPDEDPEEDPEEEAPVSPLEEPDDDPPPSSVVELSSVPPLLVPASSLVLTLFVVTVQAPKAIAVSPAPSTPIKE
jgi:hypothetical protein